MVGNPLDKAPRVHKNQSRAMLLGKLDDASVDFVPHLVTRDRTKQRRGNFDSEIERALVTNVDHNRIGSAVSRKKMRDIFDWLLGRGKADANRRTLGQRFQP